MELQGSTLQYRVPSRAPSNGIDPSRGPVLSIVLLSKDYRDNYHTILFKYVLLYITVLNV